MTDEVNRLPAVKKISGLGRSSIYDGMADGTFPQSVKIGKRAVGWLTSDLNKWLEARTSGNGQ